MKVYGGFCFLADAACAPAVPFSLLIFNKTRLASYHTNLERVSECVRVLFLFFYALLVWIYVLRSLISVPPMSGHESTLILLYNFGSHFGGNSERKYGVLRMRKTAL